MRERIIKTFFGNKFENSHKINNFVEKYRLPKLIPVITIEEIKLEI